MKYLVILCLGLFSLDAYAADLETLETSINSVLLFTATALVLFMQIGFAFLEAGVCRSKNTVNIMMKNFVDIGLSTIAFWAVGYAILYGDNIYGFFGTSHFFLAGEDVDYGVVIFQMMFAATAVTITSGAMAERTKFVGYLISAVLITALIYPVVGSWIWGGVHGGEGWLAAMGFIDFAGSSVVHSVGGWVALAGIIVLGARSGRFDENGKPRALLGHNLIYVGVGAMILWVGWFGFNVGSLVAANESIGQVLFNTQMAGAGGLIGIVIIQKIFSRTVLLTTAVNGALGGLVSITAGANVIAPEFALLIGFIGAFFVFFGEKLLLKLGIDDVIGSVPVHAFCGVWGTMAAGIFFQEELFSLDRILVQGIGVGAVLGWSFISAILIYILIDAVFGLRVDGRSERRGLDFSEHYEVAYPEFTDVVTHEEKI